MKTAQNSNGTVLPAGADAPPEATCPYCGEIVILRRRKLMNNGGYTYFWRHPANVSPRCPGRARNK